MEHRYTKRKPVDMHVVLSCPRVGLFRGRASDVSLGGMRVFSDCVVIPLHAPVVVSILPHPDRPQHCVQAQGMVIHQNGNAFGLMFDDLEPECVAILRELLSGMSDEAVAISG